MNQHRSAHSPFQLTSTAHEGVAPTTFIGKESWNTEYGDTTVGRLKYYGQFLDFLLTRNVHSFPIGLSKLANILHIKHLQQRLDDEKADIVCIAVDPGSVATENVGRWLDGMSYLFRGIIRFFVRVAFVSPREGAMNSAYATASPEVKASAKTFKGVHLQPVGKITEPSKQAKDMRLAKELYDTSLDLLREMNL